MLCILILFYRVKSLISYDPRSTLFLIIQQTLDNEQQLLDRWVTILINSSEFAQVHLPSLHAFLSPTLPSSFLPSFLSHVILLVKQIHQCSLSGSLRMGPFPALAGYQLDREIYQKIKYTDQLTFSFRPYATLTASDWIIAIPELITWFHNCYFAFEFQTRISFVRRISSYVSPINRLFKCCLFSGFNKNNTG